MGPVYTRRSIEMFAARWPRPHRTTPKDRQLAGHARRGTVRAEVRNRWRDRLVAGSAGNLSVKVGESIAITPSGIPYDEIRESDICVVDSPGEQLMATRYRRSRSSARQASRRDSVLAEQESAVNPSL
ncbi:MAG: class II aldolase/adducin family protein [Streptosporangiaceae bacterium]